MQNIRMPRQDALIGDHHFVFMVLNVLDGRLHFIREQPEQSRDLVVAPAFLKIVEHVIDGNTGSDNLGATSAVDHGSGHRQGSLSYPTLLRSF